MLLKRALAVFALLAAPALAHAAPSVRECIATNEHAQDLRHDGKLVLARAGFMSCMAASCPGAIREDCLQRLHEVDVALPKVVFDVTDASGKNVDARVSVDGRFVAGQSNGVDIPVDPGARRFVIEGADGSRAELELTVREGEGERRVTVRVGAARSAGVGPSVGAGVGPSAGAGASAGASAGANAGAGAAGAVSDDRAQEPPGGRRAQRGIGIALGGAGVVGLAFGSVLALVAKSTYSGAAGCPGACTSAGYDQGQKAYTEAAVATAGFIGGAVLLAGGVVVFLTAPRSRAITVAPVVGHGSGGLAVGAPW